MTPDNIIYQQIDGVSMGSPLGPIYAIHYVTMYCNRVIIVYQIYYNKMYFDRRSIAYKIYYKRTH